MMMSQPITASHLIAGITGPAGEKTTIFYISLFLPLQQTSVGHRIHTLRRTFIKAGGIGMQQGNEKGKWEQ
jgi:hypothetical protein